MNLEMMPDRVLVRREEEPNITAGGVILPDNRERQPLRSGTVVLAGSDAAKADIAVGQVVWFRRYAGHDVLVDGDEFVSVLVEDVVAIVEK